jgi:glutathione peroxidase
MYEQLQKLYAKFNQSGFEVLAFPCNQFGKQEPGSNAEIKKKIEERWHASFPIFDKIDVNGKDAHPIFNFLRAQLTGTLGSSIKWNFTKFLCDRQGVPRKRYGPSVKPFTFDQDILYYLSQQ